MARPVGFESLITSSLKSQGMFKLKCGRILVMRSLIQTLHDISLGLFVNSLYAITHANGDISDKIMLIATTLTMLGANLYKRIDDGNK